jgi:aminoglycoside phosphotransferase family enzyme
VLFEEQNLAAKVRFLSEGAHLGEPGVTVERVETHFAWVFLTPHYVYKLRKPICHHGMDSLSLDARHARCNEELRLNQALAPGIYLKVLPLVLMADGQTRLRGAGQGIESAAGEIVDWLLLMRRLPADRMFDRMIREGSWQPPDLEALIAHLHAFYAQTPSLLISGPAYCRRLSAAIQHNRDELLAAGSLSINVPQAAEVASSQEHWVDTHRAVLMQRAAQGMIRDCHGDLKPEHVSFGPPVNVIDRLEFDADLRLLDPLEDLCFLWLECIRLGAPLAGERLVCRYLVMSGQDVAPALADFYVSHRALTRAKLAAWRSAETSADRVRWRIRIQDYITLAADAMRRAIDGRSKPGSLHAKQLRE